MPFDRLYTNFRTPYGSFDLVTWSTTLKVRVVNNHSAFPLVTIVFYHVMEVSCYHSFWAVTLRLCLCLVALGSFTHKYSWHSVEVCSMSNLSALTSKSALRSCLRIHLVCLTAVKNNLFGPPRLPQEMQRRSSM